MHRRLLIVSSLALGSALLFSNGNNYAWAQNKNITDLAPKSGWSVSRINSQASAADSYCALSREYDQGLVLTLGRNAAEEYSLAIDFQSAKLNTKKAYPVTLQPSPGQIRAYEMMPASQRAMVVRLGYDDSFFDALEESGMLKAEIDNVAYQFQVTSFSAGKADLNNCLAGLKKVKPKEPETKVAAKEFSTKDIVQEKVVPAPEKVAAVEPKPEPKTVPAPDKMSVVPEKVDPPKTAKAIVPEATKIEPQPAPKVEVVADATAEKSEPIKLQKNIIEPRVVPSAEKIDAPVPPPVETPKVSLAPKTIEMARISSEQKVPRPPEETKLADVKPVETKLADVKPVETKVVEEKLSEIKKATPINPPTPETEPPKVVSKAPKLEPQQLVRSNNDALLPDYMVSKNVEIAPSVPPQKVGQTAIQKQQRDALEQLRADNERLNKALQAQAAQPAANVQANNKEVEALQKQIDALQNELIQAKVGPNAIDEKLKADAEKLRQENQQLKMAMQAQTQAQIEAAKQEAVAEERARAELEESKRAKIAAEEEVRIAAEEAKAIAEAKSLAATKARLSVEEEARAELEKQKRIEEEFARANIVEPIVSKSPDLEPETEIKIAQKAPEASISKMPDAVPATPRMPTEIATTDIDNDGKNPDVMRQLNNLKAENERLSAALQGQEQRLSSFDSRSPAADKELEEIRQQLKMLQEENIKLSQESRKARGQIDTAVYETGNQALTKIREYEKKLDAAQNDNLALSKEIEELRRMQEDGLLNSVSGDWDLEKSTKRYNEAEREIKRLGMLLEQQRVAHRQEKAELEGMLFDPAVTDEEQRRRLTELELQLAAAEKELRSAGRGLPPRPTMPRAPIDERVAIGASAVAPASNVYARSERESLEMQRLNNQAARQNQQLQAYGSQMTPNTKPIVNAQTLPSREVDQALPRAPVPQVSASNLPEAVFGQNQIQQLLTSAGIAVDGAVSKQGEGQYRWNAGNVMGQAQIIPMSKVGSVDQFAQNYIAQAKQACKGDFASLPSNSTGQGRAFEVACIGGSRSTSSSLLFTQKGSDVVAIAHEASADNMDAAMDARDRVASRL